MLVSGRANAREVRETSEVHPLTFPTRMPTTLYWLCQVDDRGMRIISTYGWRPFGLSNRLH
jgi:hypothetical protein